jgi:hypothetical protein
VAKLGTARLSRRWLAVQDHTLITTNGAAVTLQKQVDCTEMRLLSFKLTRAVVVLYDKGKKADGVMFVSSLL